MLHVAHGACIAFHSISYHVVSSALFVPQAPPFRPALSREFQPYKPHAAPLLHICDAWGADPKEVLIIGDSHKDDVSRDVFGCWEYIFAISNPCNACPWQTLHSVQYARTCVLLCFRFCAASTRVRSPACWTSRGSSDQAATTACQTPTSLSMTCGPSSIYSTHQPSSSCSRPGIGSFYGLHNVQASLRCHPTAAVYAQAHCLCL